MQLGKDLDNSKRLFFVNNGTAGCLVVVVLAKNPSTWNVPAVSIVPSNAWIRTQAIDSIKSFLTDPEASIEICGCSFIGRQKTTLNEPNDNNAAKMRHNLGRPVDAKVKLKRHSVIKYSNSAFA